LAQTQGIAPTDIQTGTPHQTAYVERYNRTARHEWLHLDIFETIEEVQQIAAEWLWTYTNERPNMGIGGRTPRHETENGRMNSAVAPRQNGEDDPCDLGQSGRRKPKGDRPCV
jgi:hypothetical protein